MIIQTSERVLREKETKRIYAWYVGTDPETWERMKKKYNGYESVAYYDTEKGITI